MWKAELDNMKQMIEEGRKKDNIYIEKMANEVANNIIIFLEKYKEIILGLLQESNGKINSDDIKNKINDYKEYEFYHCLFHIDPESPEFHYKIGSRAGKMISEKMEIKCNIAISLHSYRKSPHYHDVVFTLQL